MSSYGVFSFHINNCDKVASTVATKKPSTDEKIEKAQAAQGALESSTKRIGELQIIASSLDRLSNASPSDVQEVAASQIQLLTGFYDLALIQARRSFRWAFVAAAIGLCFFLAAVTFLLNQKGFDLAAVSVISGALIEILSGVNLYLYARATDQLSIFHSRLDQTQRFLLANSFCENLEGEAKQSARVKLIDKIAG